MKHSDDQRRASERGSPKLEQLDSLESFTAKPIGSYYVSTNAAFFWLSDSLEGMMFWGRPDNLDIDMIEAALRLKPAPLLCDRMVLIDLRQLEAVDLRAFGRLSSMLTSRKENSRRLVSRQAVLRPDGPAGAIADALFAALNQPCSYCSFSEVFDALEWVGVHDRALVDELERITGASSVCPPIVRALHKHLDRAPASTAREAAHHFGVSQRTLQRRLREFGTSYQREADLARLEVAKRLLRMTANPLKCTALDAGYASPQHFSASFRKHTRLSPSRWRARHQK